MLTHADMTAWVEIQDGLDRAAEREWEAARLLEFYERRKAEVVEQIGWAPCTWR